MKNTELRKALLLGGAFIVFGLLALAEPFASAGTGEAASEDSLRVITGTAESTGQTTETTEAKHIFVYVCGAVKAPGVYELSAGSRCYEAVEAAGGYLPEADPSSRNPAGLLSDGEMLRIAFLGEETSLQETSGADGRIDINAADSQKLQDLPGIGPAKAEAIIEYRESNGPFQKAEDIMLVSGIGESLYSRIKNRIKV